MTENKRFTIEPVGIRECIVDNTNGEQLDTFDYTERLCELLNELAEENNIGKFEIIDKEVTVDLNELDINIQKEIIFKSDLNAWIERKISYYECMMEKTDGCNYVSARGHLDMLIMLKEWLEQRK